MALLAYKIARKQYFLAVKSALIDGYIDNLSDISIVYVDAAYVISTNLFFSANPF